MEGIGHVKACFNFASVLLGYGHQITFLIKSEYSGDFQKLGFQEIILKEDENQNKSDPISIYDKNIHPVLPPIVKRLQHSIVLQHKSPKEKLQLRDNAMFKRFYEEMKRMNSKIEELIHQYGPDLIIVDHFIVPPCIAFIKNIPWVYLFSGCPDFLYNSAELPPLMSGLPSNDRTEWPEYRKLFYEKYQKPMQDYQNQLNKDLGYPPFSEEIFFNKSPFLNLYGYPKELDYTDIVAKPDNFLQLDSFFEYNNLEPFELPEEFRRKIQPGDKLIYISLGSCGPIDVELMKTIVEALRHTQHKYIVSKGPLHDCYELADNMWGKSWLDQRRIIPMVDLVLMHGGNNTLTECMMHGKPMLVMPLFFDQYSNAQRIHEKRFGLRIDPYNFTAQQLIDSINQLMIDVEIRKNLRQASERIRQSKSVHHACNILEQLVSNFQIN